MKTIHAVRLLVFAAGSVALAQVPTATPVCVEAGPNVAHMTAAGCNATAPATPGAASPTLSPTNQVMMNVLGNASYQLGYQLGQWLFGSGNNNDAAVAAAAAEAAREQQAELARQQALKAQRQQAIFDRLSRELMGMTDVPHLQMMGTDNTPQLQMMGMGNTPQLQMMGMHDAVSDAPNAPAPGDGATGAQTCFFGDCGPQDPDLSEPIETWNDPMVVDLRDVQQGVDLADVATKAPPADRQTIMDQALAAANGDQSIQVTIPAGTAVPVVSEQGLLAFQQANNAYRQAHDSAYQLQQSYQMNKQREAAANAIVLQSQQQFEADLRANIDQMTLEQKQMAMAQIFDAALDQELAYGKTWAQYLTARQKYYQDQYNLQMYLWNTALGKQGNPPSPPKQLSTLPGPPNADLNLVLPLGSVVSPTKDDLHFLEDLQAVSTPETLDPLTAKVLGDLAREQILASVQAPPQPLDLVSREALDALQQEEAEAAVSNMVEEGALASLEHKEQADALVAAQPAPSLPPNLLNHYANDPNFRQALNAERQTVAAAQQQSVDKAVQEADAQWERKLADLRSQGLLQPDVPLAQQTQANPQLAAQLVAAKKQVTAELDYKVKRAQYEAQRQWQQWIEQQEAAYKPPVMSSIAGARD